MVINRILCLVLMLIISMYANAQNPGSQIYHPDIIVIKLKSGPAPGSRIAGSQADQLNEIKALVGAEKTEQVLPQTSLSNARSIASGLQNIYNMKLSPNTNI